MLLGSRFMKKGFYKEKSDLIEKAVYNYADAKKNKELTEKERNAIKMNAQEILREIMIDN
ncbi:MAG: hypothetical protein KAI81_06060 [Candidatus Marinimicrobia bacterium]|nr:hypothetical protein [Candidatus Neomarinimicrobiota bacterium]